MSPLDTTEKLTTYNKKPDGTFKLAGRLPDYKCGQMITIGSKSRTVPYVRIGSEMFALPIIGEQLGKLSVCDMCLNQASCLAGPNHDAVLTRDILAGATPREKRSSDDEAWGDDDTAVPPTD